MVIPRRKSDGHSCPHTMTIVRSARLLSSKECPVCLERFFDTPPGRQRVTPVKIGCNHLFCRECIETHLSSAIDCPLPWCKKQLPKLPGSCDLCAHWNKTHSGSPVLTVRANEMTASIKDALNQFAMDDKFFDIPMKVKIRFLSHIKRTLKRFEWQFHSGVDLAELLDPFLLVIDIDEARAYYGARLSAPAPDPSLFPVRTHDPDDYPAGKEPWIAGFLRQWALGYEKVNGEKKDGWGVWTKKDGPQVEDWAWEWAYKKILGHRVRKGKLVYLAQWVGERFSNSWVDGEQLAPEGRMNYDRANNLVKDKGESPRKRRRTH
ncbi:hypothetical protein BS50DRAFT_619135 [Corynespora cassiicola Philippines]|uniref:RING-type domain-containing protein n=1 Tax=Corynespora cassiicola Philippines TaxID=1448308 RepID=A0A2T2NXV1_CORCC|nr:hypothetical protein BS50DRAFT_619135 [Corynespora cassiicola Philippines]